MKLFEVSNTAFMKIWKMTSCRVSVHEFSVGTAYTLGQVKFTLSSELLRSENISWPFFF